MIKIISWLLLIIVGVIFQLVVMPVFSLKGVWPNLILIISLILALENYKEAILFAGVGGLLYDLGSPLPFGINTWLILILVILTKFIFQRFFSEMNIFLVFSAAFSSALILSLSLSLLARNLSLTPILIEALYTAFLGAILFRIFKLIAKETPILKLGEK